MLQVPFHTNNETHCIICDANANFLDIWSLCEHILLTYVSVNPSTFTFTTACNPRVCICTVYIIVHCHE